MKTKEIYLDELIQIYAKDIRGMLFSRNKLFQVVAESEMKNYATLTTDQLLRLSCIYSSARCFLGINSNYKHLDQIVNEIHSRGIVIYAKRGKKKK